MTENKSRSGQMDDLRRRADKISEENTARTPKAHGAMPPEDALRLLHELQVHQIELEMQNEELREAREELEASREQYFDLYDLAPVGYITLSEHGLILQANLAAASLFGVARSNLVDQSIARFIISEDQGILSLHGKGLSETGASQAHELRLVKADGTHLWAHMETAAAQQASGEAVYRVTFNDITEEKRAAEELKKSRDYLAALHNSLSDAVFTVKLPEREIRFVNKAVTAIFGYPVSECIGQASRIFYLDEESYSDVGQRLQKGIEEGVPVLHVQQDLKRKNGESFPAEITVTFRKDEGQVSEFICVVKDITERKQAENTLREKQEHLEAAYRLAHLGVWHWDAGTKELVWSDEIYRIFGRDSKLPPPALSEHVRLYAPGHWDRQRKANKEAFQSGTPYQLELQFVHADGARRWITSFGGPLFDASGRIVGLQGTVQDITDRKYAQEKQRKEWAWKNLLFWLYDESPRHTDKEIFDYTLEQIVALTDSKIGFFHRVSDDQQEIILTTWNREALKSCTAVYDNHYPIERAGNWVDCVRLGRPVIYNDFPNSPHQKGLPEGHTPLHRFMSIPVVDGEKVRIIFGVGNKEEEYNEYDLIQVQLMAHDLQRIIVQRWIEESLQSSEKRYREMMELLPVTVFEANKEGRIHSFNPATVQTFGLQDATPGQGLDLFEFVSPGDRERAKANLRGVLNGEENVLREYTLARTDGSLFPAMLISRSITNNGEISGLRGVVIDLTEIKKAEETCRMSEEKYRSIYENAIEGIFQTTADGRFISANPALARMHGWDSPAHMMARVTDIGHQFYVHPETRQSFLDIMSKEGAVTGFEFEAYRRDGSRLWASVNAHTIKDEQGHVLYYEGTSEDITQRKEAEEQLRQAYIVLKETSEQLIQADKLAAVGTLAAGVAHEIMNPLNIIALGIAALEVTQDLPAPVKDAFAIFERQIDRVVRIAQDLQHFSRKSVIEKEVTDLRDLMQDTLTLCGPRIKVEGLNVEVDYDDAIPEILLDKERIGQVFLNIVNNAIDAMADREKKELHVAMKSLQDAGDHANRVLISFSDHGTGIRPEDLDHIFDPFFTTKKAGKGTGLGLSISHGIVQTHGGRIWAKNNPEGGATFYIELPLDTDKSSEER